MDIDYDKFNTGDILMFSGKSIIPSWFIETFTDSIFSHTGIVLRNPQFCDRKLEGLYILQSLSACKEPDAESGTYKFGVQITELKSMIKNYDGAVYWRKLCTSRNEKFYDTLKNIHDNIHNKPYDLDVCDWVKAYFNIHIGDEQLNSRYICSALVSYIYDCWEFLPKDTPWTIVRPVDVALASLVESPQSRITFRNCYVAPIKLIKKYDSFLHNIYNTYPTFE